MKKILIILIISLWAAVGLFAKELTLNEVVAQSARNVEGSLPEGSNVAVVNFTSPSEIFSDYVIEELTGALVNGKKLVIVDRRNLDLIRDEMNLQLSGDVSDESMLSIGKQLGAHYLVSGSITNMGRYYRFRVVVIGVETAVIKTQIALDLKNDAQVIALIAEDNQSFPASAYFGKQKFALGTGVELNMNSRKDVAGAIGIINRFDANITPNLALGAHLGMSFSDLTTLEAGALFRWYIFNGLFVEADGGIWFATIRDSTVNDDNFANFRFMGGAKAGMRIPLARNTYIEPAVRAGYPFMLGVGIMAGIRMPFIGGDDPVGGMTGRGAPAKNKQPAASATTFQEQIAAIVSEVKDDSIWLEFDSEGRARLMVSVVFPANSTEFEGLSKEVLASNERTLKYVSDILKRVKYSNIIIEGHANPTQPAGAARNREENELKLLSRLRALTVVDELRQFGVNLDRRNVQGLGSDRLVAPYNDQQNNWKNRRVEFILVQ